MAFLDVISLTIGSRVCFLLVRNHCSNETKTFHHFLRDKILCFMIFRAFSQPFLGFFFTRLSILKAREGPGDDIVRI